MPDAGFRYGTAQLPGARQHLRVDEEPWSLGQQFHEDIAPKYLQGAITIANARAQERPDQEVIPPGKKAPRPAIFTVETKADGNGVMFRQGKKRAEIGEMKLAIGIGKRDTVVGGRFKPGPQGGAVSQVGLVPKHANPRMSHSSFLDQCSSAVGAAVIYNDNFVLGCQLGESLVRFFDRLEDAGFLVVGGNHQRERSAEMRVTFHGREFLLGLEESQNEIRLSSDAKVGRRIALGKTGEDGWIMDKLGLSVFFSGEPSPVASQRRQSKSLGIFHLHFVPNSLRKA
jgi:hypothetical protein